MTCPRFINGGVQEAIKETSKQIQRVTRCTISFTIFTYRPTLYHSLCLTIVHIHSSSTRKVNHQRVLNLQCF